MPKFVPDIYFIIRAASALASLQRAQFPYNMAKSMKKNAWDNLFKIVGDSQELTGQGMPRQDTFQSYIEAIRDEAQRLCELKEIYKEEVDHDYLQHITLKNFKVPATKSYDIEQILELYDLLTIVGEEQLRTPIKKADMTFDEINNKKKIDKYDRGVLALIASDQMGAKRKAVEDLHSESGNDDDKHSRHGDEDEDESSGEDPRNAFLVAREKEHTTKKEGKGKGKHKKIKASVNRGDNSSSLRAIATTSMTSANSAESLMETAHKLMQSMVAANSAPPAPGPGPAPAPAPAPAKENPYTFEQMLILKQMELELKKLDLKIAEENNKPKISSCHVVMCIFQV